jgi:hypothetical protein
VVKTLAQPQEIFHLRALCELDGMYRLTATPRHGYGQAFWFSDFRFSTPEQNQPVIRNPPMHCAR